MATHTAEHIASSWARSVASGEPHYETGRTLRATGLVIEGFSGWGRSDAIAQLLPAGRRRRAPLFLLTGDRWQNPGWGHSDSQTIVRLAIARVADTVGIPVLIVPFSALDAAGIERASINLLGSRPDESWSEERTSANYKDLPRRERILTRTVERTAETLERVAPGQQRSWIFNPATGRGEYRDREPGPDGLYHWKESEEYRRAREPDGLYHWVRHFHRLGDSVFTADVLETRTVGRDWTAADVVRSAGEFLAAEFHDGRIGRPELERRTAVQMLETLDLSEPITETVQVRRRRRFVSSFDTNEPWPAYFLATLPSSSRARTVETALEDLAPAAVHAALARGRDVIRQGDIFAIATDLSDEEIFGLARTRARLTILTRGARARPNEIGYVAPTSASAWRRIGRETRRAYIAGARAAAQSAGARPTSAPGIRRECRRARESFERMQADYRAKARSAVFRGRPSDAEHYRDRLESHGRFPPTSRAAKRDEYRGRGRTAADRMNECFSRALHRYSGRSDPAKRIADVRAALAIHGTTHSATDVVKGPGGTVYVRGILRHVPEIDPRRAGGRDHVDIRLGDGRTWYLAVRNTVPRNRGAT